MIKLNKTPHNPGLTGAVLIGYLAMEANLQTAVAGQTKRSVWGNACEQISAGIAGMETPQAIVYIDNFKIAAREAIGSPTVAKALDEAGYGSLDSIMEDDKGRESVGDNKAAKQIGHLFGERFRLKKIRDKASTTVAQYCDNIRLAVEYGVEFRNKTVNEVVRANRESKESNDPASKAARESNDTAAAVGATYARAYKTGTDETRTLVNLFTAIMDGWPHMDADSQAEVIGALGEYAEASQDAKETAAKLKAEAEAETGEVTEVADNARLPDVNAEDEQGERKVA